MKYIDFEHVCLQSLVIKAIFKGGQESMPLLGSQPGLAISEIESYNTLQETGASR